MNGNNRVPSASVCWHKKVLRQAEAHSGDVVKLSPGDMIPATVRLLSSNELLVNQGSLAGVSQPVRKYETTDDPDDKDLLGLHNIGFAGSRILSGIATAVVIATGEEACVTGLLRALQKPRGLSWLDSPGFAYWAGGRLIILLVLLGVQFIAMQSARSYRALNSPPSTTRSIDPRIQKDTPRQNLASNSVDQGAGAVGWLKVSAGMGAGALAGLGGLAVFLLGRRRYYANQATVLFRHWSQVLADKTAAMQELRNRLAFGMGLSPAAAAQRFSGRTLECHSQMLRSLDEIAILSAAMDRALRKVKAMLDSAGQPSRTRQRFSVEPYQAALRRMQNEPLVFRPEEGVESVIHGPPKQRDALFGPAPTAPPFFLSLRQSWRLLTNASPGCNQPWPPSNRSWCKPAACSTTPRLSWRKYGCSNPRFRTRGARGGVACPPGPYRAG